MVRLTDLHEAGKEALLSLDCPVFIDKPFTPPKALNTRKVALVSSAGLIQRDDVPFRGGDAGYRQFDNSVPNADILVSHISVNFDRTAASADIENIFPRDTLASLANDGEIAEASDTHYSFMGATDPMDMQQHAKELARDLLDKGVDSVVFLPV